MRRKRRRPGRSQTTSREETCRNPWDDECRSENIALYIIYKGRRTPICRDCWKRIARTNLEWTYEPRKRKT